MPATKATSEQTLRGSLNKLASVSEKRTDIAPSIDSILMGRALFAGFNYVI